VIRAALDKNDDMAKLFPGILYATLAGVPAWLIGMYMGAPRRLLQSPGENVAMLVREAPFYYLLHSAITFTWGAAAWVTLRALGALSLPTVLLIALAPAIAWIAYSGGRSEDPQPWWPVTASTLAPALAIGVTLWWFTVWKPA
jgi:hypothetical protein